MEYKYSKSFLHDLQLYESDDSFLLQLSGKIKEIKRASTTDDISGLEPIRKRTVFFRFKVTSGRIVYRVCVKILHNKVWFTLIDTDKKRFYKRI